MYHQQRASIGIILVISSVFAQHSAALAQSSSIPTDELLALCKQERYKEAKKQESQSMSSSSKSSETNVGANVGYGPWTVGGSYGSQNSSSSSSSDSRYSSSGKSYSLKDCDAIFQTYGQITIEEIRVNRDKAIAVINGQYSLATEKVKQDGETNRAGIWSNTEKYKSDNDVKKAKIQTNGGTLQTGIGAAAQVFSVLINRPPRQKEAASSVPPSPQQPQQVAVAPMIDPVESMLRQWGWTRVSCVPGAAFIKGLSAETICVNPTASIPAGEYIFDASTHQLQAISVPIQEAPTLQKSVEIETGSNEDNSEAADTATESSDVKEGDL